MKIIEYFSIIFYSGVTFLEAAYSAENHEQ